jgi:hypothetical protein
MLFAAFLSASLFALARLSLAADSWSERAHFDDAQRAGIDFALLSVCILVVWVGAEALL